MLDTSQALDYYRHMAETLIPVDDLFSSPEFGRQLDEWQKAQMAAAQARTKFTHKIGTDFADQEICLDAASWALDMSPEDFNDSMFADEYTVALNQQRITALATKNEEKETLLRVSAELGAGQFALYGLWFHLVDLRELPAPLLQEKVKSAEADFNQVDT